MSLAGPWPDVLDDEAYVGKVGVVLRDRDQGPASARGVLGTHLPNGGPGRPNGVVVAEPYNRDEDGLQDRVGDLGEGDKVHNAPPEGVSSRTAGPAAP